MFIRIIDHVVQYAGNFFADVNVVYVYLYIYSNYIGKVFIRILGKDYQ